MFSLIITVNSFALCPRDIFQQSTIQSLKDYRTSHHGIFVTIKYDIPSLIWPPPKRAFHGSLMTSLMRGLS